MPLPQWPISSRSINNTTCSIITNSPGTNLPPLCHTLTSTHTLILILILSMLPRLPTTNRTMLSTRIPAQSLLNSTHSHSRTLINRTCTPISTSITMLIRSKARTSIPKLITSRV
jgi:hypothetical protein